MVRSKPLPEARASDTAAAEPPSGKRVYDTAPDTSPTPPNEVVVASGDIPLLG